MKIGTIQSLACVGLGAMLGFVAATRDIAPLVAGRRGHAAGPAGRRGGPDDRDRRPISPPACSEGVARNVLLARAGAEDDHGQGRVDRVREEAEHRLHHGRRRRLVQHRRLSPGHDGRPDAEPRPAGRPGDAVHRLLRRGELHGRPGQLHHRPAPHPHRHDHRGPGGRHDRPAGPGADHRHGAEVDGLRHRPVRQEPPGRPQRVPAHRPRLRRVLRLPLSPGRDGGPGPSQLPAGAQGQGRPAQHGP